MATTYQIPLRCPMRRGRAPVFHAERVNPDAVGPCPVDGAVAEDPARPGLYVANFAVSAAGTYAVSVYTRAGGPCIELIYLDAMPVAT